jgi:hypothetical protein
MVVSIGPKRTDSPTPVQNNPKNKIYKNLLPFLKRYFGECGENAITDTAIKSTEQIIKVVIINCCIKFKMSRISR